MRILPSLHEAISLGASNDTLNNPLTNNNHPSNLILSARTSLFWIPHFLILNFGSSCSWLRLNWLFRFFQLMAPNSTRRILHHPSTIIPFILWHPRHPEFQPHPYFAVHSLSRLAIDGQYTFANGGQGECHVWWSARVEFSLSFFDFTIGWVSSIEFCFRAAAWLLSFPPLSISHPNAARVMDQSMDLAVRELWRGGECIDAFGVGRMLRDSGWEKLMYYVFLGWVSIGRRDR